MKQLRGKLKTMNFFILKTDDKDGDAFHWESIEKRTFQNSKYFKNFHPIEGQTTPLQCLFRKIKHYSFNIINSHKYKHKQVTITTY